MIISIEKKFIFIANLKTASTSIESELRPHGDIVVRRSELGKHLPYAQIQKRFKWLFDVIDEGEFFKFGVIRDPVDYALSLYKSHRHEKFKDNPRLYTGDMSFDDFMEVWVPNNKGQLQPQIDRFIDIDGNLSVDQLIVYSDLDKRFPEVMKKLGIPEITLPRMNVSPDFEVEVTDYAKSRLKTLMERDYKAIANVKEAIANVEA
ncbi:sulfotransferase family 2 domain-containing protein [Guyparkeria hydrothermalis]|uniref:sulfotransferase family 2 domain-containing protein n=1 Tax=Guyparkeria hydrothermalis TaxID=923 RepID=UPI0020200F94|nr:sulfotransferase family 2 domain-containing protein [Guyparkeria hydrothermalis]